MRRKKFQKGREIQTIQDLAWVLAQGAWVYWRDVPRHPLVIRNMMFSTLQAACQHGIIHEAIPTGS